ncbi:MAG: hypothetical protein MZW92_54950 [Comamonadaceae bacterium]|nr:hypothetical protein [Comamonadaceae bacterium]
MAGRDAAPDARAPRRRALMAARARGHLPPRAGTRIVGFDRRAALAAHRRAHAGARPASTTAPRRPR